MTSAATTLRARLIEALRVPDVAAQAGVAPAVWASVLVPRVFVGVEGFLGGRSRGRLPFLEVAIIAASAKRESTNGGRLTSRVTVRAHIGGSTMESADDSSWAILTSALGSIRGTNADNYLAIGDEQIAELQPGPYGYARDLLIDIEHSYDRTTYEAT